MRPVAIGAYLRGNRAVAFLLFGLPVLTPLVVGIYLYHVVTSRFEGRRYSVPSRVYSDSLQLAPGLRYPSANLKAKLHRLGYREASTPADEPGKFRAARGTSDIEIYLHDFDYELRSFTGFPVTLHYSGDAITEIRRPGEPPLARIALEPEIVGTVYDRKMEDRTLVKLADVSPKLVEAIVAVEDRDFYHHGGINPRGILRAVFANLRGKKQGGSTLTMQLVKNLYLSPERKLRRKAIEAVLAVILDARYKKSEILESYLNEIYLGQRGAASIDGVQEACRYYFGTDASRINLAEAALLAGMIRLPGAYNPWRHPEMAKKRRSTVLDVLVDQGKISRVDADAADLAPLTTIDKPAKHVSAPYFVDYVLSQIESKYGRDQLGREGLRVFTTLDADIQLQAEEAVIQGLESLESRYKRLESKDDQTPLQAALIAITPQNGYVRAMVGGRDYGDSQFNRATSGARQPGSLFKPFVYLTAFEKPPGQAVTTSMMIRDSPITLTWDNGKTEWTPRNYDGQFHGEVTIRQALEQSLNIPTVRVATATGLPEIIQTARRCGISSRLQGYPSLALGAFEITPIEIASAYCVFANGGIRIEPTGLLSVVDSQGRLLERAERPLVRAATPEGVYILDSVLKGVLDHGTAARARGLGVTGPMAGKTGTTNNFHDAWFIGFSPRILAAVWIGFDDERNVGLAGGTAAVPIWSQWVRNLPPSWTQVDFPRPRTILEQTVDPEGAGLAVAACPTQLTEPFRPGTEPTNYCRLHGGGGDAQAGRYGPQP